MSYCVNCGVELHPSLTECPLCNTPVINPKELTRTTAAPPFPMDKGQVELVKRKDMAVLLSVVLIATALTCGLLNLLLFNNNLWSLPIIGICAIIWVFAIPFVIYTRLSVCLSILLDGIIVCMYLYLLTFMTGSNAWFYSIALPITLLVTLLLEAMDFLRHTFRSSILATALYVFIEIPVLCIGIEVILDLYFKDHVRLSWSAIVLTVCAIIDIALITILSKKRLRNAVRRRLHF